MRRASLTSIPLILITLSSNPAAAEPLGEHPAIVARRVIAAQGYDYASKFYPHPAWLYLRAPQDDAMAITDRRKERPVAATEPSTLSQAQLELVRAGRP
jgi:hypothetical protein